MAFLSIAGVFLALCAFFVFKASSVFYLYGCDSCLTRENYMEMAKTSGFIGAIFGSIGAALLISVKMSFSIMELRKK